MGMGAWEEDKTWDLHLQEVVEEILSSIPYSQTEATTRFAHHFSFIELH